MIRHTTTPPPTERDLCPPEYPCAACGVTGPAAIVAFLGAARPCALCAACAGERAHRGTLVSAFWRALTTTARPARPARAA